MSDERSAADSVEIGLRRVTELDPGAALPASDPDLMELIRSEIRRSGPMTFARFMELALYDPRGGYYTSRQGVRSAAKGPGRSADFLTAPESHPIFGWAVARHLESVWQAVDRPARFVIREHGAGTGALAEGVLDGLRRSHSDLVAAVRYQPIDASAIRLEALGARLEAAGLEDHLEPPTDAPETGATIANELLDALPVHLVEGGPGGELLERFVGFEPGGSFDWIVAEPSTRALAARLEAEGVRLEPGQQATICLALEGWVASAAAQLSRGELLLIDYGDAAAELYRPARGSTLMAYHRHRAHADPLVGIGRQDLTAHVDLTAVERAATAAGLAPIGRTRQADFLAALETGELLVAMQSDPGVDLERYLEARSALVRMLDPRVTGGFAVVAFGRDIDGTALRGFDRLPR